MELPDAGEVLDWLADPDKRDLAIATLFAGIVAHRAYDAKSLIARFMNTVIPQSDEERKANAAYIARVMEWSRVNREGEVDWAAMSKACNQLPIGLRHLCLAEMAKRKILYDKYYGKPMPEPGPGVRAIGAPPDAEEVLLFSAVAFMIALKPEIFTETLKGIGSILQGVGEIVPG